MYDARSQPLIPVLAIPVAIVLAAAIGSWAFVKAKRGDQTITVTGSAKRQITSDFVVWRSAVSYQAPALSEAYRSLSEAVPKVKAYLISKGIPENEITILYLVTNTSWTHV